MLEIKNSTPMNQKNNILFLFLSVLFLATGFYIFYPQNKVLVVGAAATSTSSIALPNKVMIPSISLSANVEGVGLTSEGLMDTPTEAKDVGWYEYGPVPGSFGSAVMAGHLDTDSGEHGIFWNLDKVKIGDDIFVVDEDGSKLNFVVTKIKLFPYDQADTSEIFTDSQIESLNLITCTGKWETSVKNYNQRLVVFSTLKK